MNSVRKLPDSKPTWGSWLKPHIAPAPPKPKAPAFIHILGRAPLEWDLEKRLTFERMEASLIQDRRFWRVSVLPENSLYVYVPVQHNPASRKLN